IKKNKIKPIQLKRYIGTAKFNNNKWIGISGLEKKYNTTLSGKNGIYSVMVTPKGHWIKNTWHLKEKPVSGENIYLNNSKKYILNRLTR
ncbi:MAG: hypothetical protein GY756_16000, partial [bacterium]|nr:hypothetical protein [bacterium]